MRFDDHSAQTINQSANDRKNCNEIVKEWLCLSLNKKYRMLPEYRAAQRLKDIET